MKRLFFIILVFTFIPLSTFAAKSTMYLHDSAGRPTGSISFEEGDAASTFKLNSFCMYHFVFYGEKCVYELPKVIAVARLQDPSDGLIKKILNKVAGLPEAKPQPVSAALTPDDEERIAEIVSKKLPNKSPSVLFWKTLTD